MGDHIEVGTNDVETIAFDAGEPITGATTTITDLDAVTPDTLVTVPEIAGNVANVTVSGFLRGHTYELAVTFARADGRRWTWTLVIECVA
ncbi:MAG: hypothetical protein M3440_09020 [Chloroflexota bacterium]|nr:hypothetical protein [Chloroflexota bacterium]